MKTDCCLYRNHNHTMYLLVYVDDLLMVGQPSTTDQFLHKLQRQLDLKHIKHLTTFMPLTFLGRQIHLHMDNTISLSMTKEYYHQLLEPHNLQR